jgi:hypothetical protein
VIGVFLSVLVIALVTCYLFDIQLGVPRRTFLLIVALIEVVSVFRAVRAGDYARIGMSVFSCAWFFWLWWKSGGDDDFKRNKKRLTEKVAALANGRLGVQPA